MALTEHKTISAPLLTWISIALSDASTEPLPTELHLTSTHPHSEDNTRLRRLTGFAVLREGHKTALIIVLRNTFIADQGQNILVEDFAFAVGKFLEFCKHKIHVGLGFHLHSRVLQPLFESIAAA